MSPADRVGPVVGLTGARFGGSARARAAASPPGDAASPRLSEAEEALVAEADTEADPAPGRADDAVEARDEPLPPAPEGAQRDVEDAGQIGGVKVRPYVRTGGRTRPAVDLALEALVSVAPGAPEPLGADHHAVAELCASPRSVAEIAALLEVPLGVARVLVGDLAQDGTVVVHGTSGTDGPDATLMQRVLDGLRKL